MIWFIFGACFSASVVLCTLYFQEQMCKYHRATVLAWLGCVEGFTVIVVVIYFVYITIDWKPYYWVLIGF